MQNTSAIPPYTSSSFTQVPNTTPTHQVNNYPPPLNGTHPWCQPIEGTHSKQTTSLFLHFPIPKMDFPHFEGRDPRRWLKKCEKFFQLNAMLDPRSKVLYAALYLEGEADIWYQSLVRPQSLREAINQARRQEVFLESQDRRTQCTSKIGENSQMQRGKPNSAMHKEAFQPARMGAGQKSFPIKRLTCDN